MRIVNGQDAAALLAPYFEGAQEERVVLVHLDANQGLIGVTIELTGGSDEVELPIRAILASALRLGSAAIIVAHNHPSGDGAPSEADLAATRRLADVARATGIRLFDHLIFAAGAECSSLRALGLI
jgi:DNA repair protein RadC